MAAGLTEADRQRLMSDPTRYGGAPPAAPPPAAPPPAAPPPAAPVPGAIPTPGQPPPQAAPPAPAPAPEERPRPDAPSGYYRPPPPEEIQSLVKTGLDEIQRMVHGQGHDQQPQGGPGPAVGADPRASVAANAYGSNAMAPETATMQEAYRTVDPEGKLSTDELQLKTLQDLHDFWVSRGRLDKAATAAASVLLYGKKVAATTGAMALSAAEDGNLLRAAQWLSKGYAYIPNGESVKFEFNPQTPDKITWWKVGPDGQVTMPKTTIGQEEVGNLATAMANGSGWLQETIATASGGRGGRGGPGSTARPENQEALRSLTAAGDALRDARALPDSDPEKKAKVAAAEDAYRTTYTEALTNPGTAQNANAITKTYWPELIGTVTPGGKAGAAEEKARIEDEKATAEAEERAAAARAKGDKVAEQQALLDKTFVPLNRAYEVGMAGNKRRIPAAEILKTIPEQMQGPLRQRMRSMIEEIVKANNMTAASAYEWIRDATDPTGTGPKIQGNQVVLPGYGGILMNRQLYGLMQGFHQWRTANKDTVIPPPSADVPDTLTEEE